MQKFQKIAKMETRSNISDIKFDYLSLISGIFITKCIGKQAIRPSNGLFYNVT
jgi:hypothetical protein